MLHTNEALGTVDGAMALQLACPLQLQKYDPLKTLQSL